MATGQARGPAGHAEAPRRPSLALQPFPWNGLQVLPLSSAAFGSVAVAPPPLPGYHRTAPFRQVQRRARPHLRVCIRSADAYNMTPMVSEYDQRCRLAVASLEEALRQAAELGGPGAGAPLLLAELMQVVGAVGQV
ncbi:hypothetical protein TSOC_001561 [Tetrabaena socialis]|uniref:Uncharacterized protein n=1 Tax=Tetrabaena socialis TaxID=47790 RepID=A0A2J8AGG0_9CHLO|nr:hypothetical protein TSOC_001561 [Tetrabaena socialis]|eukprot:PNH11601.1 hypothetical protein TSOC_001561 [Tetrabaena socialis]